MTDFILFDWLDQLGRIGCFTFKLCWKKILIFFPSINKVTNQSINTILVEGRNWNTLQQWNWLKRSSIKWNWKRTQNLG